MIADVARLLGNVHVCTVMRLEKQECCGPIRLNKNSRLRRCSFAPLMCARSSRRRRMRRADDR